MVREPRDIDEVPFDDWDTDLKTHLYGMFFTLRRACSYMKKQKYGRVVNTASHTAFGYRGFADYSAVKEVLRNEKAWTTEGACRAHTKYTGQRSTAMSFRDYSLD